MMVYAITFVLAFCSIVYELLLGQTLSAFLGNTVLRYSVTIGLYMMSLGIGSMIAEGRFVERPVTSLLRVEILLTLVGGSSVVFLFFVNALGVPPLVLSVIAHTLIIVIGILSGFEIPLMISLKNFEAEKRDNAIIGVNYLGAFLGTMVFAFVLYPFVGLVTTAFFIAFLNAIVGVLLLTQAKYVDEAEQRQYRFMLGLIATLMLVLVYCLIDAERISELVLQSYLTE
jgi:spermidine synthase